MSVTKLPREFVVIICNGTTDDPHQAAEFKSCPTSERFQSAPVSVKSNRAWCATRGWGRGLRKGRKRGIDHCPSCMKSESAIAAKLKAERKANQAARELTPENIVDFRRCRTCRAERAARLNEIKREGRPAVPARAKRYPRAA